MGRSSSDRLHINVGAARRLHRGYTAVPPPSRPSAQRNQRRATRPTQGRFISLTALLSVRSWFSSICGSTVRLDLLKKL